MKRSRLVTAVGIPLSVTHGDIDVEWRAFVNAVFRDGELRSMNPAQLVEMRRCFYSGYAAATASYSAKDSSKTRLITDTLELEEFLNVVGTSAERGR